MNRIVRGSSRVLFAVVFACSGSELVTTPDVPLQSIPYTPIPFPDSITKARGLPPLATDSTAKLLGDTVVQTWATAFPVRANAAMQLNLRVLVRDTSSGILRGRTLPLNACPFVLRLHRGVDRSAPLVWQSDKASGVLRCPTLQPFSSTYTDVSAIWDVAAVLGDSLRAGKYALSYAVRTADGRALEFASGASYLTADRTPPTRDLSSVKFEAYSQIGDFGPRTLKTVAIVKNTGARQVLFNYGACNVNVRLYRNPDRSGAPVWRSEYRRPPGSTSPYACILPLYTSVLPAGDSITFSLPVPMYEVIADSLAAGRYYVSAELSLIDDSGSAPNWEAVRKLDAGAVDIVREPDRLPSSRTVDGLSFTATTRLVRGDGGRDTIRTLVLVTNTTNARRTASVSRDCPIIVYAYRSAALRDSVPIQNPVAYRNPTCFIYPYSFALEPGQSWVFGRDEPMTSILGSGHLWFTAWMPGTPSVVMAAGDVDLR